MLIVLVLHSECTNALHAAMHILNPCLGAIKLLSAEISKVHSMPVVPNNKHTREQ